MLKIKIFHTIIKTPNPSTLKKKTTTSFVVERPSVPMSQQAQGLKHEKLSATRNPLLIKYQTSHQGKQNPSSLPLLNI